MRAVTLALGVALSALFAWVVIARFANPVDAEWMTGAVRDTVERVRDGKPIYIAPAAEFIPFLYTPIYYWLAGALAHVTSVFVACKLVSLAATAATAFGIARIATRLGAGRFWAAVAVLLHLGTYSVTLFFYDLERVDATGAAFVVLGVLLLLGEGLASTVAGGVVLGLAFFAKQPGLLAFAAAIAGLVAAREKRRALVAVVAGGVAFVLLFAYLELTTGPWFRYYTVKLPGSHGVEPALISTFFIADVPKVFLLAAGSVAIVAPVIAAFVRGRGRAADVEWRDVVFAAVVAGGLLGAFSLRSHRGGWANVILAWTPLACTAVAVAASRAERLARGTRGEHLVPVALLAAVALQLLGGAFDPNDSAPSADDRHATEAFRRYVRRLEESGEVIVTTAGNVTRSSHFHAAALFDVLRANEPAPAEYLASLRERRFAALVVGAPDEFGCKTTACAELSDATLRNYFVAARFEERPIGMIGFDGRARWVMRPRKTPLVDMPRGVLEDRIRMEMGLADMRRIAAKPGADVGPDDEIEEIAAAPDHRWRTAGGGKSASP